MHFYSLLSSLILFVLLLCISDSESLKTLKNLAVRHGGSLTIPCLYDEKYKSKRKYWCKGQDWLLCKIVASTNTSGRTSVTDHPTQNMFTVELNSLQDSGYYWCAVEISGGSDDGDYVYLTVSSDPAVSVINSRVSGQEGGGVSVQCLYRAEYKNKQIKWCRFKDKRCFLWGRTDTSQNSAVLVSDDRKGSVSVEMRGLQKSDAGWYWFSAGDVGFTVHLTVTERPSTTTPVTPVSATEKTSINETTSGLITNRGLQLIKSRNKKNEYIYFVLLCSETMTKNTETTTAELTTAPPAVTASEKENDTSKSGKIQYNNVNTRLIWILLAVGLGLLLILTIIITCMLAKKCSK
ncbi:polymeric immunoglobulin receptor-like isoform X1 [Pygocentrus nattereri]|uniref:polymeric immunoglobulin receptor-like isoform X1 n=1 Tax=Pygocentrus nattereri TaxID=42514 RepID=UPI0018916034|nr:polymeric immunoglobulin receptor-like isoform X1 [Pygocentrus nattereri]XP_037387028.1 polymeric immunoglobulin receptor-like isoform X1 [Pygocentrus nattereri]XP_037387029.1 polymeric immunoglobulin receptor-like isoform X1 [Pygocentrus nattereri]XP_037387030.1 polymeric immunoglobulin receptor-like isoform X1 [Pygocentrus nattereri]